jgi:adenosylmethionine-8-amino-7-oxononanoate aminotransferase
MSSLSKASHLFYQTRNHKPRVDRSSGVYLWDQAGNRYLDGSSGAMVSNIGHSHPRVIAAMQEQLAQAAFAYRLHFENDAAEEFAAHLADVMPPGLNRVFFASGGSETVESCLKLARQYALARGDDARAKIISLSPSYHGCTLGLLGVTEYGPLNDPFMPMYQAMPSIAAPTAYRDRDELSLNERGRRYADLLEQEIQAQGPETVLAFLAEPVGGASTGALVAPDSYYPRIREICDRYGVLLIADEVLSGAGRTGEYLALSHWGVQADLVALAKGLAAGYCPLGAVIAREDLVESVLDDGGFMHGYTYAGNPLACAAGKAVLEVMLEEDLMIRATRQGAELRAGLQELQARFPFIGDVRGKGLLLAFELVADRETWEVLPPEWNAHSRIVELAYEEYLILYSRRTRGGYSGDHLMVCPPLCISDSEVAELLDKLNRTLERFALERQLDFDSSLIL